MQTTKSGNRPVLSQTENNTTLWIGHLQSEPNDHVAGQIFQCPSEGLLNNIQVYSSTVHEPGEVSLTVHEFDIPGKTWGPAIGNASQFLQKGDDARWIQFSLQPILLKKDAMYGFRLESPNALIGIGEAATANNKPFSFGYEWKGNSSDQKGHFLTYFSLAYKIELCA